MYIYTITNKNNGKKYVGQTKRSVHERYLSHMTDLKNKKHKNKLMQKDYDNGHSFEVLQLDCVAFEFSLDNLEKFWIKKLKSSFEDGGYNLQSGGRTNYSFSSDVIERFKGRKNRLGKTHSDRTKEKISLKNKGRPSPNKGKTASLETKEKQRLAKLGKSAVHSMIKVYDNFGNVFDSVKDAANFHGLKRTTVSANLSGQNKSLRCGINFQYLRGG